MIDIMDASRYLVFSILPQASRFFNSPQITEVIIFGAGMELCVGQPTVVSE